MIYLKYLQRTVSFVAFGATIAFVSSAIAESSKNGNANVSLQDDTYVTLSGTVGKITDGDEFELRYSNGTIMVDTNDHWPNLFDKNASQILKTGDRIQVSGEVDDNFFAKKEIEATRITYQGENHSRTYWSEEDYNDNSDYLTYGDRHYREGEDITLTGTVGKTMDGQEFMLNYVGGSIKVDADDLRMEKTNRLRTGDRVIVMGEIDDDWFEKREIEADRIVRMNDYPPMAKR